jgi:DNA-nicking Smr family endonuclease|tara:strand:- start:329 stop:742 length:414 start_codon:yes stop_codon:yes gene_type:complete
LSNKISDKDKKDWENFLSSNEKLPNKDTKQNKKISKIKRIDLHGYTLQEANTSIEKFIDKSYDDGVSKIIVVTGKGLHSDNERDPYVSKDLSILKYSIPEFIKNNVDLMKKIIEIKEATAEDGGSGAFYVFIKKKIK